VEHAEAEARRLDPSAVDVGIPELPPVAFVRILGFVSARELARCVCERSCAYGVLCCGWRVGFFRVPVALATSDARHVMAWQRREFIPCLC
jgi:hypothetical protein